MSPWLKPRAIFEKIIRLERSNIKNIPQGFNLGNAMHIRNLIFLTMSPTIETVAILQYVHNLVIGGMTKMSIQTTKNELIPKPRDILTICFVPMERFYKIPEE